MGAGHSKGCAPGPAYPSSEQSCLPVSLLSETSALAPQVWAVWVLTSLPLDVITCLFLTFRPLDGPCPIQSPTSVLTSSPLLLDE